MAETPPVALIVDDEPDILELLELTLSRMGVESVQATDLQQAHAALKGRRFDFCLTDMRLPDGNGIDLIHHIQQHTPETPVAMISAHGNMDVAIEALKAGAFDFLNKPVELQSLRELVTTALRLRPAEEDGNTPTSGGNTDSTLIGESKQLDAIRATVHKLARSQAPVYISGESGTGKELVARQIHSQGPRSEQPFIAVNCGAIPSELMESELFGHKKGSFTGATTDKEGLFHSANGGTLFLDEVADLPLEMQVKLLRAIQEKAVRPVGANMEQHIDVRILSATHKDLQKLVSDGKFREDLFYRINVIELNLPPLRERHEDIPLLTDLFVERLAREMGVPAPSIDQGAREALAHYHFPGNIRELENILERAITLCEGDSVQVDDLRLSTTDSESVARPDPQREIEQVGLDAYLEQIEREALRKALEACGENKTAAAKRLGMSFRSFRYRLQKLGLEE